MHGEQLGVMADAQQSSVLSICLTLEWAVLYGTTSFTVPDSVRTGIGLCHHAVPHAPSPAVSLSLPTPSR